MNIEQLSTNGYQLTNVFETTLLNQVVDLCKTFTPTHTRPGAPASKREVLIITDGLYDTICNHFTPVINQLTPVYKYMSNITVELWRDYPEYDCPWHLDDPSVQNVIIVYLSDAQKLIGTGYEEDGKEYSVDYTENTGIALLNSDAIRHGMVGGVPDNFVRHSLYITWKCFNE